MNPIIILLSKTGMALLKLLNRGSSYPGMFAKMLNKNILNYFKLPKTTIFVTGSNGKTEVTSTLAHIYSSNGYKVGHNIKGSNMTNGVITCFIEHSNLFGEIKTDVLIIEIDERYIKDVFNFIEPTYLIINNLSRDQVARNGHTDIVWEDINQKISNNTHLILNVDDPMINKFSLYHQGKITFYGVAKNKHSKNNTNINNLDLTYCPRCNAKLIFNYYHYWNIGDYECPNKDFKRIKPHFEARLIKDDSFEISDQVIPITHQSLHNIYNLTACFTIANISGINSKDITNSLKNFSLNTKRLESIKFANRECILLVSKNENAVSYNQSIDFILKQPGNKSVVIGFDNVSRRYKLDDLSWLWDINFELLRDKNIKNIICVGKFAYDIAVRMKYAEIDPKKIITIPNSSDMVKTLMKKTTSKFYSLFCFEIQSNFRRLLKKGDLI